MRRLLSQTARRGASREGRRQSAREKNRIPVDVDPRVQAVGKVGVVLARANQLFHDPIDRNLGEFLANHDFISAVFDDGDRIARYPLIGFQHAAAVH